MPSKRLGWGNAIAALLAATVVAASAGIEPAAGGPKSRVLKLSVEAGGEQITATLASARRPYRYSVRLNGHRISGLFDLTLPRGHAVGLGLDDGLRFGKNVLRVSASYPGGRTVHRAREVRISARRPLVGAPDVGRVHAGVAVAPTPRTTLRGGARVEKRAFAARQGRLAYDWELITAPDDSNAQLAHPNSRRPRIVPDTAGIYQLKLTVSRRGASSSAAIPSTRSDVLQIEAQSPEATRAGVFIGTEPLDAGGSPTALRIFGGDDAGTFPIGSPGFRPPAEGPVVTLVIDRCTLDVVDTWHSDAGPEGAIDIPEAILGQYYPSYSQQHGGCTVMVVTAGANYGQVDKAFADMINAAVGQSFLSVGETEPFWAVWIPDQPAPSTGFPVVRSDNSWVNNPAVDGQSQAGRMAGVLVPDTSDQYTFKPSNVPAFGAENALLTFHMDPSGISLPTLPGAAGYPAPTKIEAGKPGCPATGGGGFQVILMPVDGPDALTVPPFDVQVDGATYRNGDTFWVNGCDQDASDDAAQAMGEMLDQSFGPVPTDVFIQGVGDSLPPANPNDIEDEFLDDIAVGIGRLGGTPEAFKLNPTATSGPGYAFAGQNFPLQGQPRVQTEVTSAEPGNPPAQLDGVLERDRRWGLAPSVGTPLGGLLPGGTSPGLALAAASAAVDADIYNQQPQFPNQGDPEWQEAMHYLAEPHNGKGLSLGYDPATACYKPPIIEDGFGDVRSAYCGGGTSCGDWAGNARALGRIQSNFPGNGHGFDEQTWNAVIDQLAGGGADGVGEFDLVDRVHCNVINAQAIFNQGDVLALTNVGTFVTTINKFLKPQTNANSAYSVFSTIFSDLLNLARAFGGPEIAGPLFIIGSAYNAVHELVNLANGSPANGPLPFNTTADTLAEQLTSSWQQQSAALQIPGDQIVSDYHALRQFYDSGVNLQQQDIDNAQTPLTLSGYTYLWKWFIGKAYPPDHLWPNSGSAAPVDAKTFLCPDYLPPGGQGYYPFADFLPNQAFQQIEEPIYDNQNGYETYALGGTTATEFADTDTHQPPKSLPGSLYGLPPTPSSTTPQPVDGSGNITPLGIHDQYLWHDLVYNAGQVQRVFQWYDQSKPAPAVPSSERQSC